MGLFSFGKRVKPRTFDYVPRYYDPVKEEIKQKFGNISNEAPTGDARTRISMGMKMRYRGNPELIRKQEQASNLRIVIIILILVMISYLMLESNKIQSMLEVLVNSKETY